MGWASLFEDTLEKLQDNIRLAEDSLRPGRKPSEALRRKCLGALKDAQVLLAKARNHLDIATSPELDLAHENDKLKERIGQLEHRLESARASEEKAELKQAEAFAELQDTNRDLKNLKAKFRKLEKDFEKIAPDNFEAAVDAFSSPAKMRKYKPDA